VNLLKSFMQLASTAEQQRLADLAGTSQPYLYKLANSGEPWARNAGAALAARLEAASEVLHAESKRRLPKLLRVDLNAACRECPYAKRCLGDRVLASHFEVVGSPKN
jgi:hypothetical protein